MPIPNQAEIHIKVAEFRDMCEHYAPMTTNPADRATQNDIAARAFECGAQWANMPETEGDEAKAIAALVGALVTGFKCGLAIRQRKANDDSILGANEIG